MMEKPPLGKNWNLNKFQLQMKPEYKLYFGDNKTGDKSSRRRRGIYTLCNFHFQYFSPCCVVLSVQEAQGSLS